MVAHPVAGETLQPHRAARSLATLWPRNDWQPVSPVTRCAPATVTLLQRGHGRGIRARTFSAKRRTRLLLQQRQVPLPPHLARRNDWQTSAGDDLHAGLAADGCL